MSGDSPGVGTIRIEVGEQIGHCPVDGLVKGDDVAFNFPNTPRCNRCGSELERAKVATETKGVPMP